MKVLKHPNPKTARVQKTLGAEVRLEGVGLHTGERSSVTLKPLGAGSGLVMKRRVGNALETVFCSSDVRFDAQSHARRSTLGFDEARVETVEHLSAALYGLGVSNVEVVVEGPEIPVMDGSALEFVKAIRKAGLVDQAIPRGVFAVTEPLFVSTPKAALAVLPDDKFCVTYTLDYKHPKLSGQTVSFEVNEDVFAEDIAPARTFCTEQEAQALRAQGLGKGADYKNTLVMGQDGPVQNRLRFADECARHKVLDLIGDLGVMGFELRGHVVGIRSGHALNRELVLKILEQKMKGTR